MNDQFFFWIPEALDYRQCRPTGQARAKGFHPDRRVADDRSFVIQLRRLERGTVSSGEGVGSAPRIRRRGSDRQQTQRYRQDQRR